MPPIADLLGQLLLADALLFLDPDQEPWRFLALLYAQAVGVTLLTALALLAVWRWCGRGLQPPSSAGLALSVGVTEFPAMALDVKICGLSTMETLDLAVAEGAALVGFNFFPKSPRYVTLADAAALARRVRPGVRRVAVLVDPSDDFLAELVARVPLELLQLHGHETPHRVAEVAERNGMPVMKVLSIAEAADLDAAGAYEAVAERLMFDAKPPPAMKNALPGGNALAFDWKLAGQPPLPPPLDAGRRTLAREPEGGGRHQRRPGGRRFFWRGKRTGPQGSG